jgi:acetyl-CoA acyltransferase
VREVFLLGVAATTFGGPPRTPEQLARQAADAALADAGLTWRDLDAVVAAGDADPGTGGAPPELASLCAVAPRSAAQALQIGWDAVASGAHQPVLCLGTEHAARPVEGTERLRAHAQAAERYMRASGASVEHFARVAAQDRCQGSRNPRAVRSEPVDAQAVLGSAVVAGPLRRLMVAAPAHGAAAVVLGAADGRAGTRARAPRVRSSVLVREGGGGDDGDGAAPARAARLAYQAAGLGPEDVDCAEIDALSAAGEMAAYEALQFAPEGHGPELVDSGFTALGGVLPVNPSGGALALGDAAGAAGLAQLCELAWQLRGEAGRRQVAGARVGLALCEAPGDDSGDRALVSLTLLGVG